MSQDRTGSPGSGDQDGRRDAASTNSAIHLVDESKTRYIHSDIYERLVDDGDDLVGLVAYGLYQSQKRRWIQNFLEKHSRTPTVQEVQDYCFIYDDEALHKLIRDSDDLIFKVTEERIKERIEEVAERALNERAIREIGDLKTIFTAETSKLTHALGKLAGYKHHIIGHILGFVVLAGASAIVLLVVKYGEPSIHFILEKLNLVS